MYTMLNALAAGSGYLRDIACGGAGNDTNLADNGDDAGQVTGDAGTHGCAADVSNTVHHDE